MKWSGTYNSTISAFTSQNFGVANPGLNLPKYWNEYFGIYKYAYVEKTDFMFQIAVLDNRPFRAVIAESNSADVLPTSFLELAETPRSTQKLLLPAGNHAVVTVRKATTAQAIMGHRLEDDEAWWNTQAGPPAAPVQPLVVLGLEPILPGGTAQLSYMVTIVYHMKFFTLNHL